MGASILAFPRKHHPKKGTINKDTTHIYQQKGTISTTQKAHTAHNQVKKLKRKTMTLFERRPLKNTMITGWIECYAFKGLGPLELKGVPKVLPFVRLWCHVQIRRFGQKENGSSQNRSARATTHASNRRTTTDPVSR